HAGRDLPRDPPGRIILRPGAAIYCARVERRVRASIAPAFVRQWAKLVVGGSMSDAREFTADLLAGRRSHISDEVARGPGASGTPEQILQRTRDSLDALESLRRTDP